MKCIVGIVACAHGLRLFGLGRLLDWGLFLSNSGCSGVPALVSQLEVEGL